MRLALLLLILIPLPSQACQVPVFRYALERWAPDNYRVTVRHGGLNADEEACLTALREAAEDKAVNLTLKIANGATTDPSIEMRYPPSTGLQVPFWQAPLDASALHQILSVPAHERLLDYLLDGASAVWVVIETGDDPQDDSAAKDLKALLDIVTPQLKLPEGVIGNQAFENGTIDTDVPGFEMDNVLRSEIPLEIAFPVMRLPNDQSHAFFRAMLLGSTGSDPKELIEPVVVAVFGRARMVPGIRFSQSNFATLQAACSYLCGACSCQAKEQNPGIDLLFPAAWEELLQGNLLPDTRTLPPLTGTLTAAMSTPAESSAAPTHETPFPRGLTITLAVILAALLAGTLKLALRPRV